MYVKTTTYAVMADEPHLGTLDELELIASKYEVEDWILEQVIEGGSVMDEYEFDNVYIITSDYIDFEMVYIYLDREEEINEEMLYMYAAVTHPSDRK